MLNKVKDVLENYLKSECNKYWECEVEENKILGYFYGFVSASFTMEYSVGGWYLSCNSMPMDVATRLYEIALETELQYEADKEERGL